MADHFSGPRALADPASDIADVFVFPSPERPGHLVLVMDVFPAAAPSALFSDAVSYRFRLRPVTGTALGGTPPFMVGEDEYTVDVVFGAAVRGDGNGRLTQAGRCTTSGGVEVSFRVGDEQPTELGAVRIFAGARLDPFFIDVHGVLGTEAQERWAFRSGAANLLEGANVLAIVVELDVAAVLGGNGGPLLAVVGETVTCGDYPVRLERMGRAEIKNIILRTSKFDPVNRDLEIRDLYNAEDPFDMGGDYLGAYRARMNANLAFFDRLDGRIDWPLDEQGGHPLTELLLADFLVVDTSKPFPDGGESDLEIERAVLAGRRHSTCGGRSPWGDIIDTLYTLLVGGLDGPRVSEGGWVDRPVRPPSRQFPYLVAPNPNPPDRQTVLAAPAAPPQEAASSPR